MNMDKRARELLRSGNLQEKNNKQFALNYATSLALVLAVGFLAGFMAHKSIADPISDLAAIVSVGKTQIIQKSY